METKLSAHGSFDNEFPSIYNDYGVMAAWSRKTLKNYQIFEILSKNDPLRRSVSRRILSEQNFEDIPIRGNFRNDL